MKMAGIEINKPDPDYIRKWDYSEYEEGKRTKIKSLWVDSYIDDKHIRDPKEIKIVKNIFKELKF